MSFYFSHQDGLFRKSITLKFETKKELIDWLGSLDLPDDFTDEGLEVGSEEHFDFLTEAHFHDYNDVKLTEDDSDHNAWLNNGRLRHW